MSFPLLILPTLGIAAIAAMLAGDRRAPIWAVAVAAGTGVLLLHLAYFQFYQADDAFISFRYAQNWAEGLGPLWNEGERVDGYTNFLWTALLAVAAKAGLPLPETAGWAGFAAAIGTFWVVGLIGARWPDPSRAGAMRWLPVVTVLLLAANGAFVTWTYAGLETVCFAFLVLLGAWLHLREDSGDSTLPLSAVVLLLASLTRPEGVLFVAITGLFKAYGWWRAGRTPAGAVWLATWAAVFAVPYAVYFAWHWSYYDHPFPNSYYAKVGSGMDQYERGLGYVGKFSREYGALVALFVPVAVAAYRERLRASLYLLTLLAAWTGYVVYVGGDTLVQNRMFVPILPVLYLLAAAGALSLVDAVHRQAGSAAARALAAGGLVIALAVTLQPSVFREYLPTERASMDSRVAIGKWLHDNVPADQTIAVTAAGAIPYYSELPTIDMLGINDRHIAHVDADLGFFPAGHEKYDSDYLLERAPELILISTFLEAGSICSDAEYKRVIGALIPALGDLVSHPDTFAKYSPESVEVRRLGFLNLLVRRDADFPSAECEARTAYLGETLTAGELQVTVLRADIDSDAIGSPPAGAVWIVVDARVENVGTGTIVVSDFLQTSLEDAEGNRYGPALDQPLPSLNADLPVGETLEGSVVFAVPPDATGLQFLFQAIGQLEPRRWVLEEPP